MKYILLLVICCGFNYKGFSQKHDQIWVIGDSNSPTSTTHGGEIINFSTNPPQAYFNYRKVNMRVCNASLCDSLGNLLAYTNGCDIAGVDDEIIEGGDTINAGYVNYLQCRQNDNGYTSGIQSALMLPMPDTTGIIFTFHEHLIYTYNPFNVITDKLLYSVVDMQQNNGKGKVIEKDIPLVEGSLAYGGLVAVKHANGKDWWIVVSDLSSNNFHILRLSKQGIIDTFSQTIGIIPNLMGEGYGQVVFSPDGSKMYRTNPYNPVMVYDFDRASGIFTNFSTIDYDYGDDMKGEICCIISPNNRFLYLSAREHLYQLDLQNSNISASQTLVATWDGYAAPLPTTFWQCQLGPDCNIYILAGGDTRFYHVIHNPDEPGEACNVEQRGLHLPTPSGASMPSFPNFRLGPIENPGVPCSPTSVTGDLTLSTLPMLSVFPNPANNYLKIIPNQVLSSATIWALYDAMGQEVRLEQLHNNSSCTQIDVASLGAGIYYYRLFNSEKAVLQTGKVLIVH